MKIWTVEKDVPCLAISNIKAQDAKFTPFITTQESTFDYPLWDRRQVHNRGAQYLLNMAEEKGFNSAAIKKVAEAVERSGMIAFVKENSKGNTSLMLVAEHMTECLC
jgi:hypothetical protein